MIRDPKFYASFYCKKCMINELIISLKVTTQSGKSAWCLNKNKTLHCYLKSAPERNKANEELIELTASLLKIPKYSIEIIKGHLSRYKTLKIITLLSYDDFLIKVGIYEKPLTFL